VIQPQAVCRFLGVMLDRQLWFHAHVAHALARGTACLAAIRHLVGPRHGAAPTAVKRLYMSVAIPCVLYAADVFLHPEGLDREGRRVRGSVGAIRKLATLQRQALLLITGALRTTATDVLEIHVGLLPFLQW
ncbi:uncharacterized protein BXZ73DRAFT_51019, partial [Epithele typhae]|uniref:uncharacterized protein n=1 Tax=Epithele typhae TaxID=378194 RepID=UPI002007C037